MDIAATEGAGHYIPLGFGAVFPVRAGRSIAEVHKNGKKPLSPCDISPQPWENRLNLFSW
jgi:hypothetical protein